MPGDQKTFTLCIKRAQSYFLGVRAELIFDVQRIIL